MVKTEEYNMKKNECQCTHCIRVQEIGDRDISHKAVEKFYCSEHESTKTCVDIDAIRDCGQFIEGPDKEYPCVAELTADRVKCQTCYHLSKMPYRMAYPTHHENWECTQDSHTMMYDDTVALRRCGMHKPGTPKNKT